MLVNGFLLEQEELSEYFDGELFQPLHELSTYHAPIHAYSYRSVFVLFSAVDGIAYWRDISLLPAFFQTNMITDRFIPFIQK